MWAIDMKMGGLKRMLAAYIWSQQATETMDVEWLQLKGFIDMDN